MIRISREVVVVSDSSKFGQRSLAVVCRAKEVRKVITDSGITPEHRRALEALGVEVVLA
jgi:DeoR/GlpR family transcriptional regulator of sugar metabolism